MRKIRCSFFHIFSDRSSSSRLASTELPPEMVCVLLGTIYRLVDGRWMLGADNEREGSRRENVAKTSFQQHLLHSPRQTGAPRSSAPSASRITGGVDSFSWSRVKTLPLFHDVVISQRKSRSIYFHPGDNN